MSDNSDELPLDKKYEISLDDFKLIEQNISDKFYGAVRLIQNKKDSKLYLLKKSPIRFFD